MHHAPVVYAGGAKRLSRPVRDDTDVMAMLAASFPPFPLPLDTRDDVRRGGGMVISA